TMIRHIRTLYERCGVGHLLMMNQAGSMPDTQVRRSLELFSREVYPAIRDLGEPSDQPDPTPVRAAAR
ncbi:MAG: hypothetical protein JO057_15505, partial [Chloroflexi bacterium]|nr:hypothetical protein [Chloroflexota bacterium]